MLQSKVVRGENKLGPKIFVLASYSHITPKIPGPFLPISTSKMLIISKKLKTNKKIKKC
jgi:hypothetical protein